jgi:hypothetical protein
VARQVIGPDVSFYQDDPGTPQEIDFVRKRVCRAVPTGFMTAGQSQGSRLIYGSVC